MEDLHRFITLVDIGSFTKAAEKLHMTQPALSIAIKKLEKNMQTTFFEPSAKHLTLTTDGRLIYELGKKLLFQWNALNNKQFRQQLEGKKRIVIGAFDSAALLLAPFLKEFLNSDLFSVDIIIDNSQLLRKQLLTGTLDICICVDQKQKKITDPHIAFVYSVDEELLPVASNHQWDRSPLKKIPFILYTSTSTTREYIDDFFIKQRTIPNNIAESTSTSFMKELALQGAGVALLPKSSISNELKQKKLHIVSLDKKITRTISVYMRKENSRSFNEIINKIQQFLK